MTNRRWLLAGGWMLALASALSVLISSGPGAAGSGLAPTPQGLVVARRYLEGRGTPVPLLDTPLASSAAPQVFLLAFPFQRSGGLDAVPNLLRRGATVVYAFSGQSLDASEAALSDVLGLEWVTPRGAAPLGPVAWRAFTAARWRLSPAEPDRALLDVRIPQRVPRAPEDAETLFRAPTGLPVVFAYQVGRGRVVVLPVEVLTNAALSLAGHLDLLERLRQEHPGPWVFDEYHHGLSAAADLGAASLQVFDLYLLQIALLYGLALLAIVRRFGPAWSDPPVTMGSAGAFLMGIGVLHHRLGHHAEGLRLLAARARELHPHLNLSALPAASRADAAALVSLAAAIARQQRQPKRTS